MNDRMIELANKANEDIGYTFNLEDAKQLHELMEKFALLIIQECNQAVLSVPCYYKDYRSQIEESVINDCGRAVLEHFGVEE